MRDHLAGLKRGALFFAAVLSVAGVSSCSGTAPAWSHDVYKHFYDRYDDEGKPAQGARWCCSGNLEGTTGDCSPATITMNRDGSAYFTPKQHPGKHILVSKDRILWGTIPHEDKALQRRAEQFEAHWCGVPRPSYDMQPTDMDPDPAFKTYCAIIAPGGV